MVLGYQNCSNSFHAASLEMKSQAPSLKETLALAAQHVRFFGYFATAMGGDIDYASEVSDHTNVTLISHNLESLTQRLDAAHDLGLQAVVTAGGLFIEDSAGGLTVNTEEFAAWWFDSVIAEPIRKSKGGVASIAALYAFDEPYLNLCQTGLENCDFARKKSVLDAQVRVMKNHFPNLPVAVIFSAPEVVLMSRNQIRIPEGIDWVGIDCYGSELASGTGTGTAFVGAFFDRCGDSVYGFHSMPWYHEALKGAMTADQKLIGVPQGILSTLKSDEQNQIQLTDDIEKYMRMAAEDSRFIAVFPFLWQFLDSPPNNGVRDMPRIRSMYRKIGAGLVGKTPVIAETSPLPTLGLTVPTSPCKDQEYLTLNADVQSAGLNPRLHYRRSGRQSGLCEPSIGACSGITAQEYLEYYDDVRTSSFGARGYIGAWEHYLAAGKNESRCPVDNIFDPAQYLLANPDLMEAFEVTANTPTAEQLQRAKTHFCENFVNGSIDAATNMRRTEKRALVPGGRKFKFDADAYLAANPDVRSAGAGAQTHLCAFGINEKRLLK